MNAKELKTIVRKIAEQTEDNVNSCKTAAAQYPTDNAHAFKVGYYEKTFEHLIEQLKSISK